MIENPTAINSTIDLEYSYRPKASIFGMIAMFVFGFGALYYGFTKNETICFVRGKLLCFDPPTSTIIIFLGSIFFFYEAFKYYKIYKASKRDQFIRITNSSIAYPENTLKPSETVIDFRKITNISLDPLTGNDRKMSIEFDNKKVIIEEKLLEYVGEFEEIWKNVNSKISKK